MTDNCELVSVVVLSYQNFDLLKNCVLSVLHQDYPQIELIISDDSSDYFDKELLISLIEENKRENLKDYTIVINDVNVGTVKNIKNAFNYVKGDFYITSGADDLLADEYVISRFIQKFRKQPQLMWVCANLLHVSSDYNKVLEVFPTDYDIPVLQSGDAKKVWNIWARRGIVASCAICYRKEVLNIVGGFDEEYCYSEDWPIFLKLLRSGYAPGYINVDAAKHSIGGISLAYSTAGIEKRKVFMRDKYHLFTTEVQPYIEEMPKTDRKKYKYYMSEIMDRSYFLDCIFVQQPNKKAKLKLALSSPKKFIWILEKSYWIFWKKMGYKLIHWNMTFTILMLVMIFSIIESNSPVLLFLKIFSISIAGILSFSVICTYILRKVFNYRASMRGKVTHS